MVMEAGLLFSIDLWWMIIDHQRPAENLSLRPSLTLRSLRVDVYIKIQKIFA